MLNILPPRVENRIDAAATAHRMDSQLRINGELCAVRPLRKSKAPGVPDGAPPP